MLILGWAGEGGIGGGTVGGIVGSDAAAIEPIDDNRNDKVPATIKNVATIARTILSYAVWVKKEGRWTEGRKVDTFAKAIASHPQRFMDVDDGTVACTVYCNWPEE